MRERPNRAVSQRLARPSAGLRSGIAGAIFVVLAGATADANAEPRETTVTLTFEDVRSADELKHRVGQQIEAFPAKLEMPNLTFVLPEQEVDGAIARTLDLIARQRIWENETVIRACGPAAALCFVITCRRCGGG